MADVAYPCPYCNGARQIQPGSGVCAHAGCRERKRRTDSLGLIKSNPDEWLEASGAPRVVYAAPSAEGVDADTMMDLYISGSHRTSIVREVACQMYPAVVEEQLGPLVWVIHGQGLDNDVTEAGLLIIMGYEPSLVSPWDMPALNRRFHEGKPTVLVSRHPLGDLDDSAMTGFLAAHFLGMT